MTIVLSVFAALLVIGMPIGLVMIISALAGVSALGGYSQISILAYQFYAGISDYVLVAIPFFILTAELMNRSRLTDRLVAFSTSLFGSVPGALSHVNIMVSMLFAGITGAAVTDAIAIGKTLIPSMKREGYGAAYCAAVTASGSIIGPIIPPSIVMIVYATSLQNVSVTSLFAAGVVPGLLMGVSLLVVSSWISIRRKYPRHEPIKVSRIFKTGFQAAPTLLIPIIILGGILSGITTVTDASVLGAFMALILGVFVYKTLTWRDVWQSLIATISFSGVVFLLLGAAALLGWFITRSGLAAESAEFISTLSSHKLIQMIIVVVFLIILGMFIDVIPAVVVAGPVLVPALISIGFDPLHVAMVAILALNVGNLTPPVGMSLMTTAKISNVSYESAIREVIPFIVSQIGIVLLVCWLPEIVLWLPRTLGMN
ncbi:TRAP transporter large permease [Pusillimonas sp. ANT_WB101]|uniref:TRAP transporter large permease n=1 Tax=Pusillimonas sp. ANT_WB101 TaxID=2597356 RepID=UPI0011EF0423|nr:TRAP transporter large permease [Pusillimonas sp. ANT_WB101]KAA0911352.1 TRAP transporter large permease [Pusillimonas sp. ANT_WB101]